MALKTMGIKIPEGLKFSDLKLSRDPKTGAVEFDWLPILKICEASEIDPEIFECGSEDNLSGLITAWYQHHIATGGIPDPVQEDLISEVKFENEHGGGISHKPGTA